MAQMAAARIGTREDLRGKILLVLVVEEALPQSPGSGVKADFVPGMMHDHFGMWKAQIQEIDGKKP